MYIPIVSIPNVHVDTCIYGTCSSRTRRLLKEGSTRSSGAAKVAQIIQKDVENTKSGDAKGIYMSLL